MAMYCMSSSASFQTGPHVAVLPLSPNNSGVCACPSSSKAVRSGPGRCHKYRLRRYVFTYGQSMPFSHLRGADSRQCRHFTLAGYYLPENNTSEFFSILSYLPSLTSITFKTASDGIPWFAVERCLQLPNLSTLTFLPDSHWLAPNRHEEWVKDTLPTPDAIWSLPRLPLTKLSYITLVWRELKERPYNDRFSHTDLLADEYAAEARGLGPLILAIRDTVQSLYIPLDVSPVGEMCQCMWPNLTGLRLRGAYADSMPRSIIPVLLSRMPRLHNLSIELAQPPSHTRAPIFGIGVPVGCEHLQLRSLTVAYPDPEDAIFSFVGVDLVHLSLRDWPRAYYPLRGDVALRFVAPILSASECLRLLTRMNTPLLESLEVVYMTVDDADDDLLRHIATAYPRLKQLEIHRYRSDWDEVSVPYVSTRGEYHPGPIYRG